MYNRYIPQPDGSFHRRQYPDASAHPAPPGHPKPEKPVNPAEAEPCSAPHAPPTPPQPPCCRCRSCKHKKTSGDSQSSGIGTFLKQLLPKDFDTGDLMVILLLLLMSSDCGEDQNTTLLTLALYLFL